MPTYQPDHVEYAIVGGHIGIAMDNGAQLPAYWAHPNIGGVFPGIALIHDWWGITQVERRLAHQFAQAGYYVIVPDLFDGRVAATPQQAKALVEKLTESGSGYPRVNTALQVLETHHRCNHYVAAIGLGMGGGLAYEAAIVRTDLEAAVCYYAFPQRYLDRLADAQAPILTFYGTHDPYIKADVLTPLKRELARSPLAHEVVMLEGATRDFFNDSAPDEQRRFGEIAWQRTLAFLDKHLERPLRPPARKTV